jgi:hypothetical protein
MDSAAIPSVSATWIAAATIRSIVRPRCGPRAVRRLGVPDIPVTTA